MDGKKISFGFMKTKKAEKHVEEEKKDFIECVEEKAIKVVGGEEVKETAPLVIPMKPNTLVTAERLKEIAQKVESVLEEPEVVVKTEEPQDKPPDNETLDQMAVRELLQDAKKEVKVETSALTVPLPAKPVNEGEKESTLDDYEAVPVQDFGMAMLRGMGWAPNKEKSAYKQPQLRPKGLGLGADKVVKANQKQPTTKDSKGDDLTIVKNAFVKITTGKHSGYYGKVVSLDEDNGRVMVELAVKKETASLSEFTMHPVTKSEFDKESKVINAGSYEEYKKKETGKKTVINEDEGTPERKPKERSNKDDKYEKEATSSKPTENRYDKEDKSKHSDRDRHSKNGKDHKDNQDRRERDRDRSHRRQKRDSSEERSSKKKSRRHSSESNSLSDTENRRSKKKEHKRYSSQDSLSSSDTERKKKNKKKDKKRHESSDSEFDHRSKRNKTPEGKRDIDKKRKGKKKKRDRDRSPNYRKHRK